MERVPVDDSTTLAAIGYDEAELTLELEFRSGELYLYRAVPSSLVLQLRQAASKGRFFNLHIRDCFPHQHLPRVRSALKTI